MTDRSKTDRFAIALSEDASLAERRCRTCQNPGKLDRITPILKLHVEEKMAHVLSLYLICGLHKRAWCPRCTRADRIQGIIWGQAHVARCVRVTARRTISPPQPEIKVTVGGFDPQQRPSDGIVRLSAMASYAAVRRLAKIAVCTLLLRQRLAVRHPRNCFWGKRFLTILQSEAH